MALRPLSPVLLVAAVLLALSGGIVRPVRGQDDPRPDERKKEALLPEGAKLRLGYGLPFRFASGFTLLPPDYQTLLVLDAQGSLERYDVATGRGRAGAAAPRRGRSLFPGTEIVTSKHAPGGCPSATPRPAVSSPISIHSRVSRPRATRPTRPSPPTAGVWPMADSRRTGWGTSWSTTSPRRS